MLTNSVWSVRGRMYLIERLIPELQTNLYETEPTFKNETVASQSWQYNISFGVEEKALPKIRQVKLFLLQFLSSGLKCSVC
jgi:hypothetical protein